MERRGLFVGIGIDAYDSHEPLQHAVAEVNAVAEVLGADFGGEPLLDADHAQVQEHLEKVPDCRDTAGSLVLLWCGHGVQSGTKLWLQTRNFQPVQRRAARLDRRSGVGAVALEQPGTRGRPTGVRVPLDGRAGRAVVHREVRGRGGDPQAGHPRLPLPGSGEGRRAACHGVHKGVGTLSVDLTEFARSLPSLHQLLPGYACIDHGGSLHRLGETPVPELNTAMVQDAMGFHADLAAAEAARPASLIMTHAIVGVRQPTWTSLQISNGEVEALDTIGGANGFGDGTVPLAGAIGHDLPMDTHTVRRIVDQHGNLQANPWALDELEEVLVAEPVRRRAGATVPVRVGAPDLILAGEFLPVVIDVEADRPPAVRIQIVAEGESERIVASRTPRIRDGHLDTSFAWLAPGAYEVRVTGLGTGSPVSPVTAPVLVWPPEPFQPASRETGVHLR
jgi:hypothetical protein